MAAGIVGREEWGPDPKLWRGLMAPEAVRLEHLNDSLNQIDELVQCFNSWFASIGESCSDDNLHLSASKPAQVVKATGFDPGVASVIERDGLHSAKLGIEDQPVRPVAFDPPQFERCSGDGGSGLKDVDVFVGDVEVVQRTQCDVTALERTQRSDQGEYFRGRAPHLAFDLTLKPGGAISEGEIHLLGLPSAKRYEIVCQQIEGDSEVVDGITKDGGDVVWDGFSGSQPNPALFGFVIEFDEDHARITAKVCGRFAFKIGNVLPCARNL